MKKKSILWSLLLAWATLSVAQAQLPPDAVSLKRVKITEKIKSTDLCPVHLIPADPAIPTWTWEGVEYGGDSESCQAEFEKDSATYAAAAAEERYIRNFMEQMSTVWCPVTDEISPGGLTQWKKLDYTWESCCDFCDDTVQDEDFDSALDRLRERARKGYEATGGKYYADVDSPLAGAIDFGMGFPDEEETDSEEVSEAIADAAPTGPVVPEEAPWMTGHELKATYTEGIGLLFEQRCVECHRPGGAAPMSFTSYGGIRNWIKNMKESVKTRSMPPWPADAEVAVYENSRHLTPAEMDLFMAWAESGYPKGEGEFESQAPEGEWNLGAPDHVFEVPEYTLGENDTAVIKAFEIKTDFDEDRWIAAAEAVPGDIYTVMAVEGGALGSFYPGNSPDVYHETAPRLLKAGESITVKLLNIKDAGYELPIAPSRLGVHFVDDPSVVETEAKVAPMENTGFTIPAGAEAFEASASFEFPADGWIYSFRPVLNQRGKSVRLSAALPDGAKKDLLVIPRWDPAFKLRYRLAEPFKAPAGTVVRLDAVYDNSKLNAKNPNATIDVSTGPGGASLEGWLVYSID